ncbi:hypothetical protein D3C73_1050650 [compost metagenome]
MAGKSGIQRVIDGRRINADVDNALAGQPFCSFVIQAGVAGQPFVGAVSAVIVAGVQQDDIAFFEMKMASAERLLQIAAGDIGIRRNMGEIEADGRSVKILQRHLINCRT